MPSRIRLQPVSCIRQHAGVIASPCNQARGANPSRVGPRQARKVGLLAGTRRASVVPHADISPAADGWSKGAPEGPFMIRRRALRTAALGSFRGTVAPYGPRILPRLPAAASKRRLRLRAASVTGLACWPGCTSVRTVTTWSELIGQPRAAFARGTRLFMLTYHDSSLLPGATRYVRTEAARQARQGLPCDPCRLSAILDWWSSMVVRLV